MPRKARIATLVAAVSLVGLAAGAPVAAGTPAQSCKAGAAVVKGKKQACPKTAARTTPVRPSFTWPVGSDDYESCWALLRQGSGAAWREC